MIRFFLVRKRVCAIIFLFCIIKNWSFLQGMEKYREVSTHFALINPKVLSTLTNFLDGHIDAIFVKEPQNLKKAIHKLSMFSDLCFEYDFDGESFEIKSGKEQNLDKKNVKHSFFFGHNKCFITSGESKEIPIPLIPRFKHWAFSAYEAVLQSNEKLQKYTQATVELLGSIRSEDVVMVNNSLRELAKPLSLYIKNSFLKKYSKDKDHLIDMQAFEMHSTWVHCVTMLDSASNLMASSSGDGSVKTWNGNTKECLKTLKGYGNTAYSIAVLDCDAKLMASCGAETTIGLWNWDTGELLALLADHTQAVYHVAVLDGASKLMASACADNLVKIWNWNTKKCLTTLKGHGDYVYYVTPLDSEHIATASRDKTIKIWKWKKEECIKTLEEHSDSVNILIVLDPRDKLLASASRDCTIKIWDWSTGECLRTLTGHKRSINSLVVLDCLSTTFCSASSDTTIKIWDWITGECIDEFGDTHINTCIVVLNSKSKRIVTGSLDGMLKIWKLPTYKQLLKARTAYRES